MQDLDWKTWGLIFVIAIGVVFEGIKRMPSGPKSEWNLKLADAASSPYQVKYPRAKRDAPNVLPTPKRIGGNAVSRANLQQFLAANAARKGEFGHVAKGAEGAAATDPKAKTKKKKDDDEWEIIIDPLTGKKYRRKKKKKVAKVQEAKVEVAQEEPKKEEPKREDPDDIDGLLGQAITPTFKFCARKCLSN